MGQYQQWVAEDVTIILIPLVCQASIFLQGVSQIVSSNVSFSASELKVLDSLHPAVLFVLQAPLVQ